MTTSSTRREFLQTASAAALGVAAAQGLARAADAPPAGARPNIVFILTDDQRFDALGLLNSFYQTPRLDELAQKGMLFENAFVTTSLCSPSRACILSGQYAHKHGVLDNNTLLPADTPTFPKVLQGAGYRTAYIGKWHMGGETDARQPGFDRWVSFRGQGIYRNPVFNVDGETVKGKGYITDLLTDYAVDFMKAPDDRPFFLFLGHKAVHAEFDAADRYKGSYEDKTYPRPATMADTEENYRGKPAWVRAQRKSWHGVDGMYNKGTNYDTFTRDYAETLRAVDDSVGRVVDTLRELGRLDNTLLVFTSDNGFQFGEHGLIDKRTMYEASIRVPLLVHWPAGVTGGQRRREMTCNIDFAPTFCEAAGQSAPDTMQGRSFFQMLSGKTIDWREEWLYEYFWERGFPQTPTVLGVRTDRYKLMQYHGIWDRYEMYDLEKDPDERNNLLADCMMESQSGTLDQFILKQAPDETAGLFKDLRTRLNRLLDQTGCAHEPNWRT